LTITLKIILADQVSKKFCKIILAYADILFISIYRVPPFQTDSNKQKEK